MICYAVGEYLEGKPKSYQEGVRFDIDDAGATLTTYFHNPVNEEVKAFKEDRIRFGYYTYKNVILLLVKIGDLNWMDAPYSVHLSDNITRLVDINEDQGLAILTMLINASNGQIKTLRLIGANHRLTKGLFKAIEEQKEMSFDDYHKNLKYLFDTYNTKQLVQKANMIENLIIRK